MNRSVIQSVGFSRGKVLVGFVVLFFSGLIITFFTTDKLQEGFQWAKSMVTGNQKGSNVTYYQWLDENGEAVVSRSKPLGNDDFIQFEAPSDLINNENNVDTTLVDKQRAYEAKLLAEQQKMKKQSSDGLPSTSVYPVNALSKSRGCLDLSAQMMSARKNGDESSFKKLKAQHDKQC